MEHLSVLSKSDVFIPVRVKLDSMHNTFLLSTYTQRFPALLWKLFAIGRILSCKALTTQQTAQLLSTLVLCTRVNYTVMSSEQMTSYSEIAIHSRCNYSAFLLRSIYIHLLALRGQITNIQV